MADLRHLSDDKLLKVKRNLETMLRITDPGKQSQGAAMLADIKRELARRVKELEPRPTRATVREVIAALPPSSVLD